jgi:hypothetical protein
MGVYFFDTCALVERYFAGPHSRRVNQIISIRKHSCYIADWTVLELASSLGRCLRRARDEAKRNGVKYDLRREYDVRNRKIARDLADGMFGVRATNSRDILQARELIRYSGIIQGNKIDTGDAIVASCGLNLAHELGSKIIFYTADQGLFRVLVKHDHFRSVMCIRLLGRPKDPSLPSRTC